MAGGGGRSGPRAGRPDGVRHPEAGGDRRAGARLPAAVVGSDLGARHAGGRGRPERLGGLRARPRRLHRRRPVDRHPGPHVRRGRSGRRPPGPRRLDGGVLSSAASTSLDVPRLRRIWASLRELPRTSADVMAHGDLTPGNVLVTAGRLAGVIDVGGLGPADPALDLVAAWHLLEAGPRQVAAGLTWAATTSSGPAARPGRSSRPWASSGTTPTATRPCIGWVAPRCNASWTHKV